MVNKFKEKLSGLFFFGAPFLLTAKEMVQKSPSLSVRLSTTTPIETTATPELYVLNDDNLTQIIRIQNQHQKRPLEKEVFFISVFHINICNVQTLC